MNGSPHPKGVRPLRRWLWGVASSTVVCALWFAYINWDGCWLYWRGAGALFLFVVPWLWLVLFFGFRLKGRIVLLATALVVGLIGILVMPHVDSARVPAIESNAVGLLRTLRSSLEASKSAQGYPQVLPRVPYQYGVEKFYRFEYLPTRSPDGAIRSYVLQATPTHAPCGCALSFALTENGALHYTKECRAATPNDPPLI